MDRDDKLKLKAINEVKNNKSIRATARKYNIPIMTLHHWCEKAGVKSKHTRYPTKTTDKQIIKEIKSNLVITHKQLEKKFGYSPNTLRRRLQKLIKENKVKYTVLSGGGKVSKIFKGHTDRRLYYISEKQLIKWIKKKLPKHIPLMLKKSISQKLHEAGIEFEFEKANKKAIVMEEQLYKQIKDKATEKNMTMIDFLNEVSN
jgi:hypothetical protein